MIEVTGLKKVYGERSAVDEISFSVGRGEIVGFLGPNGAGKTTTLRMLTTLLKPTAGMATVAGADLLRNPLEVRKKIGYVLLILNDQNFSARPGVHSNSKSTRPRVKFQYRRIGSGFFRQIFLNRHAFVIRLSQRASILARVRIGNW